jgi:predicted metal-dependent HD superfamily phosphohydrolase
MESAYYDQIREAVAKYVTALFAEKHTEDLVYHNLNHTEYVVQRAQELALAEGLNDRDFSILFVAAWFHDVGYLEGGYVQDHEARGVEQMRNFFANSEEAPDAEFVETAAGCIRATQVPQRPTSMLEGLLCDADTYNFGTKYFKETNKQMEQEFEAKGKKQWLENWPRKTYETLNAHTYFSSHAQELLLDRKQKNIDKWREKAAIDAGEIEAPKEKKSKKDIKLAIEKHKAELKHQDNLVSRGVQTSLKLANENHIKLSDMADGKANILISVNSIIIGVILSVLLRRLEVDTYLTIPTMIFLGSSVGTIVLAILATLPNLTTGRFTRADVEARKTNLLFFGNFHRTSLSEYTWAMQQLLKDQQYIYDSIVKDIYFLGVVLGRKYKLVRWAYYLFMFGLISSVIAFVIAIATHQPDTTVQIISPAQPPL